MDIILHTDCERLEYEGTQNRPDTQGDFKEVHNGTLRVQRDPTCRIKQRLCTFKNNITIERLNAETK